MSGTRRVLTSVAHLLAALGFSVIAASAATRLPNATLSPLGPETSIPFGWLDFCQRYAGECDDRPTAPREIELTAETFRKISGVNALVNSRVEPVADLEHAGVPDSWDYPEDGKGDCEDYALMKRRVLISSGFPRSALLLAVVKDRQGDGHLVLIARTSRGDLVLDNLSDDVSAWTQTPYRFVKRQSQENQNVWVAVGTPTSAPMYVAK